MSDITEIVNQAEALVEDKPYKYEMFIVESSDKSTRLYNLSNSSGGNTFEADKKLKDDLKKLGFVKINKDGTQQEAYAGGEATKEQLLDAVNSVNRFYASSIGKVDEKGNLCIVQPNTTSSPVWIGTSANYSGISYTVLYAEKIDFVPAEN